MTPLRLALVTRRFWPLVGGAEIVMANLAEELFAQGHHVEIVTAQWQPEWPKQISHRGIPVWRIANPSVRGWGTLRYMANLGRWLRQNQNRFDAVYVSMLKHSAVVAISRLQGSKLPVILRAEGSGETGDCAFHEQANFGRRIRRYCQKADGLVAPSSQIYQELIDAGFSQDRVQQIPNGVRIPEPSSTELRVKARATLATANPALTLADHTPLVVFTGRLHPGKGLAKLVRAWPLVLEKIPAARLWIVGDGPQVPELAGLIQALALRTRVVMPGAFDTVEDMLQAANLFVLPSLNEGMSISLLEAQAIGLPCVVSDIPGNRILVKHGQTGMLFPLEQPGTLANAIVHLLADQDLAQRLGLAAREQVEQQFSLSQTAASHVKYIRQVIERKKKIS